MLENKQVMVTAPRKVEVVTNTLDERAIGASQILVKKKYSLISAGTETACVTGKELWFKLPGVLGYSAVGQILAVGEDVEGFSVGDVIYFQGKHSQYEVIDTEGQIIKVPDNENLRYIPFIRMAAISSSSVRASDIEFGDVVLVVGQGLIGLMAMQLARLQGAKVIAVDTVASRLEISKKLGADIVLNPMADDVDSVIKEVTGGSKVDTFIDATGNSKVILDNLKYVKVGGEALLLGSPRAPFEANITQVFQYIHQFRFRIDVKGAHEFRFPAKRTPYVKHSTERTLAILIDYINSGRFQVGPMLTNLVKPEEAPAVYKAIADRDERYLGVVFDWNE